MCLRIMSPHWVIYDGSSTQLFMCYINMSYSGYDSFIDHDLFDIKLNRLQANCWFMVSFIYECLGAVFHGPFAADFLYTRKTSEGIRQRIRAIARLILRFPFETMVSFFKAGVGESMWDCKRRLTSQSVDHPISQPTWLSLVPMSRGAEYHGP